VLGLRPGTRFYIDDPRLNGVAAGGFALLKDRPCYAILASGRILKMICEAAFAAKRSSYSAFHPVPAIRF
jgi:hypothetical protein